MHAQDASAAWTVGKRYLHGKTGRPVTLRYIGTLPPDGPATSQLWLGIEYDDPALGKHSGRYEGVQVFQTRQAGAGAFVKRTSAALKPGPSFVDAFEERYGSILPSRDFDDATRARTSQATETVSLGDSGIIVEAPGMDDVRRRISRLERLREVSLNDQGVASLGGSEAERQALKARLRGVHTLNLSGSLLTSWEQVADIVDHLINVETLVLSKSRLDDAATQWTNSSAARLKASFGKVEELHLGDSALSWADVVRVATCFPCLKNLHLNDNTTLESTSDDKLSLGQLERLSLSGCPLARWSDVPRALSNLPSLRYLDLSKTAISSIQSSDSGRFLPIDTLILLGTRISNWTDVDALETWTRGKLRSLRISLAGNEDDVGGDDMPSTNPLIMTGNAKADRPLLIAKLSALEMLNLSPITSAERRDAEELYVKLIRETDDRAAAPSRGRYAELCSRQGATDAKPVGAAPSAALKSRMITIHLYQDGSAEKIDMAVLPSTPIALLRKKVSRRVKSETPVRLWTARQTSPTGEVERVTEMEDGESVDRWMDEGDLIVVDTE